MNVSQAARCFDRWRRGWDSNPRWACTHGGFQDRCLKPLGHLSLIGVRLSRAADGLCKARGEPSWPASGFLHRSLGRHEECGVERVWSVDSRAWRRHRLPRPRRSSARSRTSLRRSLPMRSACRSVVRLQSCGWPRSRAQQGVREATIQSNVPGLTHQPARDRARAHRARRPHAAAAWSAHCRPICARTSPAR